MSGATPAPPASPARGLWRIFRIPIVLALATAVGLVAGLLGDGVWDAVSWFGLGAPLLVALACWLLSRGKAQ